MSNNFTSVKDGSGTLSDAFSARISRELDSLKSAGNFRALTPVSAHGKFLFQGGKRYLNFSSNDYLGLSASALQQKFFAEILVPANARGEFLMSNPASRLMTGNSEHYAALENVLGELFGGKSALVLGSGFLANSGLLPALAHKGDLVLADKLVHASVIEGLRLCEAEWKRFRHNDVAHLESLLKNVSRERTVWVVTESIFSMDGDIAPLREIAELKKNYGFRLCVDEAHAFGVVGPGGRGIAAELGLADACDVVVATFGKALASAGAVVITDALTREYLVNKMRTLIFSTALPPASLMWTRYVAERLGDAEFSARRARLRELRELLSRELGVSASSHIIPIPAGENARAIAMANAGKDAGFWLTPIRHPTVPAGTARIRLSLSAAMEPEEIHEFCRTCKNFG